MNENDLMVIVEMITYNHERYIAQAIESVMMQKTSFDYKLLICEDCSTDGTQAICLEYKKRFPDKIHLNLNEKNLGVGLNAIKLHEISFMSNSKYIAICDGDDYWSDPLKLQKQIDFLEANPAFAICFHNLNIESDYSTEAVTHNSLNQEKTTTLTDLLRGSNYIGTASCIFRNQCINFPSHINILPFGDYFLHLSNARYGKIRYINEVMGTYRVHEGGMHGSLFNDNLGKIKAYQQHYIFWTMLLKYESFDKIAVKKNIADSCDLVIQKALETKDFLVMTKYNIRLVYFGGVFRLWNFFRNYIRFIVYMFRPNS